MRDEQRDRMLVEIARSLELLLANLARTGDGEALDQAEIMSDVRRTFERNYE
jgi:hypothetical protein